MADDIRINEEEKLLLGLCRLEFNKEQTDEIGSAVRRINDWNHFLTMANEHGIAALVYHNLEKLNFLKELPEETKAFLRGTLMMSLSQNVFNSKTLAEALRLLNAEHIKTVILKGIVLENTVYGNAGLRQMSDIDILIKKEECIRARNILLRNGYVSLPVKSFFHESILEYTGKHLPELIKGGVSLEIHHQLFGGGDNPVTRQLFDTSYEVEFSGERTSFPEPLLLFLYQVRHLHVHETEGESQLRLYTDLIVLIEKYRGAILSPQLINWSLQAGMSKVLAGYLFTLREIWKISLSELINDFVNMEHDGDPVKMFVLFLKNPRNNPARDYRKNYRNFLKEIPGIHRRILYVIGDIFPSVRFMKERYGCSHTWKVFIYYPHRLGKLLWLLRK